MHITTEQTDHLCRLHIAGEATIYTVIELHRELFKALVDCTALEIDLSEVSDLDTAGFQQLLLAKREAVRLGKALRLVHHSAATRDVLDIYQMADYFDTPLGDSTVESPQ